MKIFKHEKFDVVLISHNAYPDTILLARALEAPYILFHEYFTDEWPIMINMPIQGTYTKPGPYLDKGHYTHWISERYPHWNFNSINWL